ncbi:MAG: hypothetical protein M1113_00610 [Candidatus Thermoplasmatota archaeon]|nr:hypothetical protein [Candidatus Thermoplasmatota archaeon]
MNVDRFLNDIDSGNDLRDSGTRDKMSSYRISTLSAEIMAFIKAMNRRLPLFSSLGICIHEEPD